MCIFFFQAEDGIRDDLVTGVQTCALPICTVASGIERRLSEQPAPVQVLRVGSVFSILFTDRKVRTYRDTLAEDAGKRAALDAAVLDRGIFVKPGKPLYLSTVHDEGAVRQTLDAFDEAISDVAG